MTLEALGTFEALGLHPAVLKALADSGYQAPTPVQAQAIPAAMEGRDLLVSSQTGSGKTAAFVLPALHRFASTRPEAPAMGSRERPRFRSARPRMLVLAPTRELALQVTTATEKYGTQLRQVKAAAILGGMPYPKQLQLLSRNPEILVATPGRLLDHMQSGRIDFSGLEILVLDEADRMLDMGFIEDIETIVAATPNSRQTMLFSATLDGLVGKMAQRITRNALVVRSAGQSARNENIRQRVHFVDDVSHKGRLLDHLLRDVSIDQTVVFTSTKRDADSIAERLADAGFAAAALHGDMHQTARNRTLNAMRRGQVRVLVATDVAARGIDVPTITHVFNFDLPKSPEDYVHRIGRTGRAGRDGLAISLVHHAEARSVKNIERFTRQEIPVDVVVGHEPRRSAAAFARKPAGRSFAGNGKPDAPRHDGFRRPDAPRKGSFKGSRSGDANGNRRSFGDR
jgi:superfamily II DNA/RNA helicase